MNTPTPPLTALPETVLPVIAEHIALTPGVLGGKPRIAGHRIKVADVVLWHERMGQSPVQIVEQHPGLTLADVHAALAYYHDHRDEIDADLCAGEQAFAEVQRQQPSLLDRIAAKRPDVRALSPTAALAYLRSGKCPAEDIDLLRTELVRNPPVSSTDPDLGALVAELQKRSDG